METINPLTIRGDEYLEGYSASGEAKISALDATRPAPVIETHTGATYTLVDADHGKILDFVRATAVTVTVPTGLRDGFMCGISQGGAGAVTVADDGTTTIVEPDSQFDTEKQYVLLTLVQFASDAYRLFGRTA